MMFICIMFTGCVFDVGGLHIWGSSMRFRGNSIFPSSYVSTCLYRHQVSGPVQWNLHRTYCTQQQSPKDEPNKMTSVKERTASALTYAGELGRQWGRNAMRTATVSVNYWWERYEEFVGLNEVRYAQSNVTEVTCMTNQTWKMHLSLVYSWPNNLIGGFRSDFKGLK